MLSALYGTGLRPGDRCFCPASPAWGLGLWQGTLAPLALGATTGACAGKFDAARLLKALHDYRVTNLTAAATHFRMMRQSGCAHLYDYQVKKLSYAGEPIDPETEAFAEQLFGCRIGSIYGTTEVGAVLVCYPEADDFDTKPGSLGRPVPGLQLEVHDSGGRVCAAGVIGEIKVWRRGAWISTRDLGWTDEEGLFFHAGRADDVIITAGWTLSAVELENAATAHPDVREAAAIGVPDQLRGQIVKLFVVSSRPGDDAFAGEIQNFVRDRLGRHEYPRQVEFVGELPKTPAGKINRTHLRAAHALRSADSASA